MTNLRKRTKRSKTTHTHKPWSLSLSRQISLRSEQFASHGATFRLASSQCFWVRQQFEPIIYLSASSKLSLYLHITLFVTSSWHQQQKIQNGVDRQDGTDKRRQRWRHMQHFTWRNEIVNSRNTDKGDKDCFTLPSEPWIKQTRVTKLSFHPIITSWRKQTRVTKLHPI